MTREAVAANIGRWYPVPHPTASTVPPAQSRIARMAGSITPSGSTARFSTSYTCGWCQMFGLGIPPSAMLTLLDLSCRRQRSGRGRGQQRDGDEQQAAEYGEPVEAEVGQDRAGGDAGDGGERAHGEVGQALGGRADVLRDRAGQQSGTGDQTGGPTEAQQGQS